MLNGDAKLNILQKIFWIISNFFRNLDFKKIDETYWKNLNLKDKDLKNEFHEINFLSSPSRVCCDLFWHNLPWNYISKVLGNNINAIEVGCGTGRYGNLLANLIKNFNYLGCDVNKKDIWDSRAKPNIKFKVINSDHIYNELKQKNFLFTQSAVEHFENDFLFFKNIQTYIKSTKKPFLQIHLLPSTFCLWKYLTHGYRQYSTSKISELYNTFWKNEFFVAFSLGGKNCNIQHIVDITIPMITKKIDYRIKSPKNYEARVKNSISKDLKILNPKGASFYALFIFSNINKTNENFKINIF